MLFVRNVQVSDTTGDAMKYIAGAILLTNKTCGKQRCVSFLAFISSVGRTINKSALSCKCNNKMVMGKGYSPASHALKEDERSVLTMVSSFAGGFSFTNTLDLE